MNATPGPERTVKAAETTFAILETVNRADGVRLTDIAEALDMSKSTVHRYLQTLLAQEYLVKEGSEYHVSLRFLDYGWDARYRKEGSRMAERMVAELAEETDERAQFIVDEHGWAVYVHRATGSHAVQTDPGIGKRVDLHATSHGKAIMAAWSDERLQAFIDGRELREYTPRTLSDPADLLADLEDIRRRGYSLARGEHTEGIRGVAAAVTGPDDEVLGALSVSGPENRLKGDWFENELADKLLGFANEIELNLKHS